jgi:hypothetical protein
MSRERAAPEAVLLRRFPYPYRAHLAICSDLDSTPDRHAYVEAATYLNTARTTRMGEGIDLEVGNTIYFDMPPHQFAYWNTDDAGRAMVRDLIRSGHVDCLHSFGELATTRDHARRDLEELARHDCRLVVWVDHSTASSNFGADIMRGQGDVPGAAVYHADLSCDFGIEYAWRGRGTSVIGQDVPRRLGGLFEPRHPVASGMTVFKEFTKGTLARAGSRKYAMHGTNRVLRRVSLRDGRPIWEFMRANPSWRGVGSGATADGIADVFTTEVLDRLVRRGGAMILYTHLAKPKRAGEPFRATTRDALTRLAAYHREGRILVSTTRRLLDLARAHEEATVSASIHGDELVVDCVAPGTGEGLSFYVPDPARTRVLLRGREMHGLQRDRPDHTGRPSVTIPWPRLEFPLP